MQGVPFFRQFKKALTVLLFLGCAMPALAASAGRQTPGSGYILIQAKRSKQRSVVIRGSGESVSERERRLKRECRGRPNAGACLGFGQGS